MKNIRNIFPNFCSAILIELLVEERKKVTDVFDAKNVRVNSASKLAGGSASSSPETIPSCRSPAG